MEKVVFQLQHIDIYIVLYYVETYINMNITLISYQIYNNMDLQCSFKSYYYLIELYIYATLQIIN